MTDEEIKVKCWNDVDRAIKYARQEGREEAISEIEKFLHDMDRKPLIERVRDGFKRANDNAKYREVSK